MRADEVARYFLAKADPEIGDGISNLKLQKLCYYAQGFQLALTGSPLFPERIEAWLHGQVVPELYHAFKHHGGGYIPAPPNLDFSGFTTEQRELLDEVYSVYGQYSAWKLRNMTHEEAPWRDVYGSDVSEIEPQAMAQYFKTLLRD